MTIQAVRDPMRELNEERLAQALEGGTQHADQADNSRLQSAERSAAVGRLEDQNRDLLKRRSVVATVIVAVVVIGAIGALILDYGGLGAMADYVAGLAFPGWPLLHIVFRLLFPIGYGCVELLVGVALDLGRERRRETGKAGSLVVFVALATILLVPPVAFMIATHNADVLVTMNDGVDLSSIFRWKLLGAIALALVPHAALIFSGHWVKEALALVRLERKLRQLKAERSHFDDLARKHEVLASEEYVRYMQCWRRLNGDSPDGRVAFGPFDKVFANLVERRFGSQPSPNGNGQPPVVPPHPPPSHGGGESTRPH